MRRYSFVAGVAATLVIHSTLWASSGSSTQSRSFTHSFKLVAGQTLRLANLAGTAELVPSSGPDLVVDATVQASGHNDTETQEMLAGMKWIQSKDREGRAEWALSYPVDKYDGFHYPRKGEDSGWWSIFGSSTSTHYLGRRVNIYGSKSNSRPTLFVDVKIHFPAGANAAYRDGAGDVDAGRLSGQLEIDTGSGDVHVESFTGPLGVDTGSGDVHVQALKGDGNFDTGSGDIQVHQVDAAKVRADTGSGDILIENGTANVLETDTGSGDIRALRVEVEVFKGDTGSGDVTLESSLATAHEVVVDTGSGDVKIYAGKDASFDLDADQGSGDLEVRYSDATYKKSGREITGARRGDGKTRIRVDTGSGDCEISPSGSL